MTAKKKAKRKPAKAAAALPPSGDIPEGMKQLGGGYAPTWQPEIGDSLHGVISEGIRTVEFKQGRKVTERRVVELTTHEGERFAIWESAALGAMFDSIEADGPGGEYFIRFDGLGKKKAGQNPPKLFTVAQAA